MANTESAVSESVLIKRVNRRLAHEGQVLRKSRGFYDQGRGPYFDPNTGEFFILDIFQNLIVNTHVDLEGVARDLGALTD